MGISVREAAGFSATSTDLVITGSKNVPMRTWASAAGMIPSGTYSGNAKDEIVLEAASSVAGISRDVTFHDRGIPYRVGDAIVDGRITIAAPMAGQVATLTIEPKVTVKFKKGGGIWVQYAQNTSPATGALIAVGTKDAQITFTTTFPRSSFAS